MIWGGSRFQNRLAESFRAGGRRGLLGNVRLYKMATFSFDDFVHRFIFQVKNGKGKYSLRNHMNRTINRMYSTVSISMCFWCWEWFLIDGWASGKEAANNSCCSCLMCFAAALFFHHFCGSLFVKHLKSYKIALFCRWLKVLLHFGIFSFASALYM